MNRIIAFSVAVVFLVGMMPASGNATSPDHSHPKAAVQSYFDALNAGNVDRIVDLYHPDAVFLPKDAPAARGLDAIKRRYSEILGKIDIQTRHKFFGVHVTGSMAVIESRSNGTVTLRESGKTQSTSNNELFILRKNQNGEWKIARYMFNGSGQTDDK